MARTQSIRAATARRIALAAQGFRDPRPKGAADRRHLRRVMRRLQLLQLDSIPIVIRTQYMPPFSRLGPYAPELLDRVAYRDDEWFEAWCHEASLLPVEDEPLLRWQKARTERGETWKHLAKFICENEAYLDEVLAQVKERPMAPGELDDPRPRDGEWWGGRSGGSVALDCLFRLGKLGIRRRPGFVKEFDLLERIVPAPILAAPTPTEEDAHRELLMRAAASYGIATAADLVDYHRLPKRPAKARVAELVEEGRLVEVEVEGWSRPGLLHPDAKLPRRVDACALLSPFDPVVWFRDRAARLFDFHYKIEIYTPAAKRVYGYYVLPFLLGDRLVARVDLKTDRDAGVLRVLGAFAEPGVDKAEVVEGLGRALDELSAFVGAERWQVSGRKGDLSTALRRLR
ncbi:hypothetical protein PPSIR1_33464 [Plesiocystis pacifica SIR-1]|uniref:Cytoplasmic protein n=1 Tax=Plesiocystis pacifica SIR-1 TaxID=391625 RepID=A6G6P9_9BACT|nr:crosslink repair DNA glycosylase YcaQ family protein [Plesiocystis pacifica]EDM78526.1 hypothetical protein PPSIR1_33464 [Plesiocystis pacifica SIR-1]